MDWDQAAPWHAMAAVLMQYWQCAMAARGCMASGQSGAAEDININQCMPVLVREQKDA